MDREVNLMREINLATQRAKGAETAGYYAAASFYEDRARVLYEELKALREERQNGDGG